MAAVAAVQPATIPACLLIKVVSIPIINYLNVNMTKGSSIYFYLNLGISRKEYNLMPFAVEFVFFILLIITAGVIGNAIR